MSFEEVIEGCEEPQEFYSQIGTLFGKWLPKVGYPLLREEELNKKYEGTALFASTVSK